MKAFFDRYGPTLRKVIAYGFTLLSLFATFWMGSLWLDCFQERKLNDPLQTELCELALYASPWLLLSVCLAVLTIGVAHGKKWVDVITHLLTAVATGYLFVRWWWPAGNALAIPAILILLFVVTFLPRSQSSQG